MTVGGPTANRAGRIVAAPAFANASNPYTSLLYRALQARGWTVDELGRGHLARGVYDVAHVHWPEYGLSWRNPLRAAARLGLTLATARALRRRGAAVVWTVHNLRPHDSRHPRLEAAFYRRWIAGLDGALALSATARELALERYPALRNLPFDVAPHGHYRPVLRPDLDRNAARSTLGFAPEHRVVGAIGQIRPYKQVPALIEAFRELPDPNLRLLIAGRPSGAEVEAEVRNAAQTDPRIRLELRFLPDEELQSLTAACDLIALTYRDILNSGSAIYALSCDVPVLAPRAGSLTELAAQVGDEAVRLYDPPFAAAHLEAALSARRSPTPMPLDALDWDAVAAATEDLYRRALDHRTRP